MNGWTPADDAELDVLVDELVRGAFLHRERCAVCLAGEHCGALCDAIEAVVDWRRRRLLRSKAVHLRALQDELDEERGLRAAV